MHSIITSLLCKELTVCGNPDGLHLVETFVTLKTHSSQSRDQRDLFLSSADKALNQVRRLVRDSLAATIQTHDLGKRTDKSQWENNTDLQGGRRKLATRPRADSRWWEAMVWGKTLLSLFPFFLPDSWQAPWISGWMNMSVTPNGLFPCKDLWELKSQKSRRWRNPEWNVP